MTTATKKIVRCAIYTRKSTEHGLDLEFNSLQAQREACEAYVKSQINEGWRVSPRRYDDAAYSGSSLDRPALQQLLVDIASNKIDIVIVYKIDRLTRSLMDFAKLVEQFEAKSVSFVAITQQFNTTTSMGRLTLNVLLSFAQFERELASERVRDKVAASRKRGKWTGGIVPLGYDVKDKKLVINPNEAKVVRYIFQRYAMLQSFREVVLELDSKKIFTKRRNRSDGKISGGRRFNYGPLSYVLKNRIYVGEIRHAEEWFPAEHKSIIDDALFEKVQQILKRKSIERQVQRSAHGALLTGLIYDDSGNRMTPSYTTKKGVRYRFYISSALLRGRRKEAGSAPRISASHIEKNVVDTLFKKRILKSTPSRGELCKIVEKIVVSKSYFEILLKPTTRRNSKTLKTPWIAKVSSESRMEEPHDSSRAKNQPLIYALVKAHRWLALLEDRKCKSIESLADRLKIHPKIIRETIPFAFLSPELTSQILAGAQPERLNLKILRRCRHLSWPKQSEVLSKFVSAEVHS